MLGIVWGCGWVCSGEILVGSFDTDAVPPSGDIIPSWRASWLPIDDYELVNPKRKVMM